MTPRGWLWLTACSASVVAANVVLRFAIDKSGITVFARGVTGVVGDVVGLLVEPRFLMALVLYGIAMLIWFRLVATEPLSVAYPTMAAATFVAVSLAGIFLLGEPYSATKIAGLAVMLIGLALVSWA